MGLSSRRDSEEYDSYLNVTRENLLRDIADPTRNKILLDTLAGFEVARVLDIGCGIGQALFPLAVSRRAFGVGVDVSDKACRLGDEFYAAHVPGARIAFARARAERLPFASASFDVVNFSLALPYTNNAQAISEVARVLRPGGLFLLGIHHTRYYLHEFWQGLISGDLLPMIHAGRVLAAGTIYHITGRQPLHRRLNETFQTRWLLSKELSKYGLTIEREQPYSTPQAPSFVIFKKS